MPDRPRRFGAFHKYSQPEQQPSLSRLFPPSHLAGDKTVVNDKTVESGDKTVESAIKCSEGSRKKSTGSVEKPVEKRLCEVTSS